MAEPAQPRFETLIYTDCRPGQGLQGTAGLQFQARSRDADRAAMSMVQRNLLYEPPSAWMRDRRDVAQYPPSFAHVAEEFFGTAAGVYLGREANGGREGNQLTHSIVTRDPAAYRQVRPAQLYGAPFWTAEPAPSTQCPALTGDWEAGPIDAVVAQETVRGDPAGPQRLAALVAALEQVHDPDGRRVLLIADDADVVLRWLTAATLLIPQERALRIGFKVFSTDPAYAAQPVVAVHPDWNSTSARVDNDSGYLVFDLLSGEFTPVGVPEDVALRARLFVHEDPYDVVDLVDVAAATGIGEPNEALDLGRAMVLPSPDLSRQVAAVAVRWLRDAPADRLAAHRGALVDQLTARVEQWPLATLRDLDAVAVSGQVPRDRVASVRLALIRKELERAVADHEVERSVLPPLPAGTWTRRHHDEAQQLVNDEIRTGLSTAAFDAVLRVAHRFGLSVDLEGLWAQVNEFVEDWATSPDRLYDVTAWPRGGEVRAMFVDRLNARVASGTGPEIDRSWKLLLPEHGRLGTPLGEAVLAAAMYGSAPGERLRLVEHVVTEASRSPEPISDVRRAADVLWSRHRPTVNELQHLCALLPQGPALPSRIFAWLTQTLQDADPIERADLELAARLRGCGLYRPPVDVAALLDNDVRITQMVANLPSQTSGTVIAHYAEDLRRCDPRLVRMWTGRLVRALTEMRSPLLVLPIVRVLPTSVFLRYRDELLILAEPRGATWHLLTALHLARSGELNPHDARLLDERVVTTLARTSERKLKHMTDVATRFGGNLLLLWEDARIRAKDVPRRRLWNRGGTA